MRKACMVLFLLSTTAYAQNLAVTPGKVRPLTKAQICTIKWGRDRRHVTQTMKLKVCADYGVRPADCNGKNYEIDHLIPRALGGADDVLNLFPQPWPAARKKDRVETYLHREVCAGRIALTEARRLVVHEWEQVYLRISQ